ncbi:hypothetical protein HBB16_16290 [Pseudonocardia sp. MCCB 268]|nr:hypothetical protein [Pseudonocardia cytotoxica]
MQLAERAGDAVVVSRRALDRVRPGGGAVAGRGALYPHRPTPTCRRWTRRSATSSPPSTSVAAPPDALLRRRAALRRGLEPAPVRRPTAAPTPGCTRACTDPPGPRQDQVSGGSESGAGAFISTLPEAVAGAVAVV